MRCSPLLSVGRGGLGGKAESGAPELNGERDARYRDRTPIMTGNGAASLVMAALLAMESLVGDGRLLGNGESRW